MLRLALEELLRDAQLLWDFLVVYDDVGSYDAVVCLCSYDLRVADRCAQLLTQRMSAVAVVTGGYGNWTLGVFSEPEADVFAAAIQKHGVARERLLIERHATNIGENVLFARAQLGDSCGTRVVFVTKPQTQRRVQATVRKRWPEVNCAITAPQGSLLQQARDGQGLVGLVDEMVGDTQRLLRYPAAGFQVEIAIPPAVLDAYNRLRQAGFDKHCIP